jgi:hypothetical protein
VTDDTDIPDSASMSFAGVFAPVFGEDGFKDADDDDAEDLDAVTYALGVSAPGGVDSGLVDTLSGDKIYLFLETGEVVGRVGLDDDGGADAGGAEAFTISVNTDSGLVTLDQSRAVVHDDANDPDESSSPAMLSAPGLVTLTATVTDGDGDTAEATANIGGAFTFEDDGPSINIDVSEASLALNLDESINGPTTNPPETGTIDPDADDTAFTPPNYSDPFGSVTTPTGAISGLFSDTTVDAGTDGPKAPNARVDTYALTLRNGVGDVVLIAASFAATAGVATTLAVTQPAAGGNPDLNAGADYGDPTIYLFKISETEIEGRFDATGDGFYTDVALKITLDVTTDPADPTLTVDQIFAIHHTDSPGNYDDAATLAIADPGEGVDPTAGIGVTKTSTLTDGDDDTATDSATYNLTADIVIEDDGHIAINDLDPIGLSGTFESFDTFEGLSQSAYRQTPQGFNINNSFGGTDGLNAAELSSAGSNFANMQAFFADGGTTLTTIVTGLKLSDGITPASLTNFNGGSAFESKAQALTADDFLSFDWAFRSAEPMAGSFDNDYAFWALYKVVTGNIAPDGTVDNGATYAFIDAGLIFDVMALRSNDNENGLGGMGYLRVDSDGDTQVDHPAETQGGKAATAWEFGILYDPDGVNQWLNVNTDVKIDQTIDITADPSFLVHGDIDANDISYLIPIDVTGTYVLRFGIIDIKAAGPGGAQPSELNIDRIRIQEVIDLDTNGNVLLGTTDEPEGSGGADLFSVDGSRVSLVVYDLDNDGVIGGESFLVPADNTVVPVVAQYGMFTIQSDGAYAYDSNPTMNADLQTDFPGVTVYDEGFLYTAIDGDGDTSTALLTIRIDATSGDRTPADNYVGSMFDDTFDAGGGNDTLTGRGGGDTLTGGSGDDRFVYKNASDSTLAAHDVITDFVAGSPDDEIDLIAFLFSGTPADDAIIETLVGPFTASGVTDFFDDGGTDRAVAVEYDGDNARVYVDADKNGDFGTATDVVIELDSALAITNGALELTDFIFA